MRGKEFLLIVVFVVGVLIIISLLDIVSLFRFNALRFTNQPLEDGFDCFWGHCILWVVLEKKHHLLLCDAISRRYEKKVGWLAFGGKELKRSKFLRLDFGLSGLRLLLFAAAKTRIEVREGLFAGNHTLRHKLKRLRRQSLC